MFPYAYLNKRDETTIEQYNEITLESFKAIGWTGSILYDVDGFIRRPTLEEISRFYQLRITADIPKHVLPELLHNRRTMGVLTPDYDEDYWNTVQYVN